MDVDENPEYRVYSFGKGEVLGVNVEYDELNLNKPTLVPLLTGKKISRLACGANHTLVLQGEYYTRFLILSFRCKQAC